MIDWHCHILPCVDDGSRDVNESLQLLLMLAAQGTRVAVATPHFHANDESVSEFLERRQKSYEDLTAAVRGDLPKVVLGAEVRYYPGIGKLSELKELCIGDTKLLLLEMPMGKWTDYTVRELTDIVYTRGVKLVLAHIERYLPMQNNSVWEKLYEAGALMQVNASFFTEFWARRKALPLLQSGAVQLIGSDCHSVKHRPPRLGKAYEIIRKKFGDEFVTQINEYGHSLLEQK